MPQIKTSSLRRTKGLRCETYHPNKEETVYLPKLTIPNNSTLDSSVAVRLIFETGTGDGARRLSLALFFSSFFLRKKHVAQPATRRYNYNYRIGQADRITKEAFSHECNY